MPDSVSLFGASADASVANTQIIAARTVTAGRRAGVKQVICTAVAAAGATDFSIREDDGAGAFTEICRVHIPAAGTISIDFPSLLSVLTGNDTNARRHDLVADATAAGGVSATMVIHESGSIA